MNRLFTKRYLAVLAPPAFAAALALCLTSCASGPKSSPGGNGGSTATKSPEARQSASVSTRLDSAEKKLKAKDFAGASADVAKALEMDPKSSEALKLRDKIKSEENRAAADSRRADVEKRIDSARKNIKEGNLVEARRNLDAARGAAGEGFKRELSSLSQDIEDAEKKSTAEKSGKQVEEYLASAKESMKAQKFDVARESVNRALALDKSNKKAIDLLASIKESEAKSNADRGRREVEAHNLAGANAMKAGDPAKATAEYKAALASDPDNKDAKNGLAAAQKVMAPKPVEVAKADPPKSQPAPKAADPAPRPAPEPARSAAAPPPAPAKATPAPAPAKAAPAKAKPAETKKSASSSGSNASEETRARADAIYQEGMKLYKDGKLSDARARWREALAADPSFRKAQESLDNTEKEFNAVLAREEAKKQFESAEGAAQEKMNTLISIRTVGPKPLAEFLGDLKLLSGIDFTIAGGIETRIEAAFDDKPLYQALDSVLLPIGLRWDRKPGEDIVVISPDLRTEVFPLTPDQIANVETLIQNGTIARLLYGPKGQRALEGQEVYIDGRQNIVVLTDSAKNIEKFRQFAETLKSAQPQTLIFKSYSIQGDKAQQVRGLLGAVLSADERAPYNPERRLIVDGNTLIIKDTPENIAKAEQLLQDKNFLREFYSDRLQVATFNLTPVIEFQENPELARNFGDQVRHVIETLLYSQEGQSKAAREGRRIWWEPATLQLTLTDYPDNIAQVERFIESLPQIQTRRRWKIFFLNWATASELETQLNTFLGNIADDGGGGADGDTLTRSISVEDEFNFHDAFFRVTAVNDNNINDQNDDDVTLVVRTGTSSQDVTIREFRSQFIEDFEIVAEDIKPSSTPGQGRARITVTFNPAGRSGASTPTPTPFVTTETSGEEGITIHEIDNLNGLFVEYTTAEQLQQIEFWVKTLDIPTLQVSIEMRFVEVLEQKARELKSDFIITDLTEGFDFSDGIMGSRFAQDGDEFHSPWEPLPEDPSRANLLKGGLNFGFLFPNGGAPISLNLSALEAAGVINITNAPSVTVLNGEAADFLIERELGLRRPTGNATTGGGGDDQNNFTAVATERPVDVNITPTITQAGNITMDIDVEIRDRESNLGAAVSAINRTDANGNVIPVSAFVASANDFAVLRKVLQTRARIKDGGTIVLGGWVNTRSDDLDSGVPILRDIPWIGPILFNRMEKKDEKVTLNIFLTGTVLRD